MHRLNSAKLKAKGWSDYEIHHAMEILREAEEKKHPKIKKLDQTLYWIFLLLAVGGNIAFSIALLPIIATMPNTMLYIIAGFTGIIFGTLCTTLMMAIDVIDTHHHFIYLSLIPVAGLINFSIIVHQANQAVQEMGYGVQHNPWILGAIYLLAFFIPYSLLYRKGEPEWT